MAALDFDDIPAAGKASGGLSFDDIPAAQPAAPMPRRTIPAQELSFGERLMSSLPKGAQDWFASPSVAGVNVGRGSVAHGLAMGAADPVVGAVQLATGGMVSPVNRAIDAKDAEYEAARNASGRSGFDAARFAGNVASPASIAVGAAVPIKAATTLGRAGQGAVAGMVGGASAPVLNADDAFWGAKAVQTGAGAVGGAVLAPIAGKATDAILRRMPKDPVKVTQEANRIMAEGVNRLRREGIEVTQFDIDKLRQQVVTALENGIEVDPAAIARRQDFAELGISPTLGQITRDPLQYARERNLSGVSGVGEPLSVRLTDQSRRIQELLGQQAANAADDATAGDTILSALRSVDARVKGGVDTAYAQARDHLGRAAPMDVGFFSKEANLVLDGEMLGGVLPPTARNILNDVTLGKIPFNVNTAIQIDQTLSRLQRGGSPAEAYAIGKVRDVLNKTPIGDNVGEDAKRAFDAARGLARDRFALLDQVPALKAAVEGGQSVDTVVRRFLINGKSEEVAALAKVLPDEARQEARRQFGAALERAAYGEDAANAGRFAPERFARFLNAPGMRQKLSAFFSPDEVAQFDRIARVGGYIKSAPEGAPVNTSNSAAAVFNLISRIPGVPAGVGLLTSAKNAATNQSIIRKALAAQPPASAAAPQVSQKRLEFLARALGGGVAGTAAATGAGVGN